MSAIINEPDRVILNGEWAEHIIWNIPEVGGENIDEFTALFAIYDTAYLRNTDFYQGVSLMRVIHRKSDDKLFGYEFDDSPGIDGMEHELYPNGECHGFDPQFNDDYTEYLDGPFWVFLPVETFSIQGFRLEKR